MSYYVYILASHSRTIYVGVTNNLERRVAEHQSGMIPGFTRSYHIVRLVYYEETPDITAAIAREKQIKGWRCERKIALIESVNHEWRDLSAQWYTPTIQTVRPRREG